MSGLRFIGMAPSAVPLAEQDRQLWDRAKIAEGQALLLSTLGTVLAGPYQLQAAIAAAHDEAGTADDTDWPQILALYEVLERLAPSPIVTLSRAVATAMVHGPKAGLALLAPSRTAIAWPEATGWRPSAAICSIGLVIGTPPGRRTWRPRG
jgi:predicted RNA polymerase sigma factor